MFFVGAIILLIALVLFLINLAVRVPIFVVLLKVFPWLIVGGILYGIIKACYWLGTKCVIKTILKWTFRFILFVGIFHLVKGFF